MTINWKDLKEKYPLTFEIIERETSWSYDPAYRALTHGDGVFGYRELEAFLDHRGWYMSCYPTEYPYWNGVISNSVDKMVFSDPLMFDKTVGRQAAKAILSGIAIAIFNETMTGLCAIPENAKIMNIEDVLEEKYQGYSLKDTEYEHMNQLGKHELDSSNCFCVRNNGEIKVVKNLDRYPYSGQILKEKTPENKVGKGVLGEINEDKVG